MDHLANPLLVRPEVPFEKLVALLALAGYERDATRPATPSLVEGEPELAGFRHPSGAALAYTYNPVVGLRVLAPRNISREEWLRLSRALPSLEAADLRPFLASNVASEVLLGILAANLLGDPAPRERIAALRSHPEPAVRRAAERAFDALGPAAEAREKTLALVRVLCAQMRPLLAELPSLSALELREKVGPRPADYAEVFEPPAEQPARAAYERFYAELPTIEPDPGASELSVYGAAAGMLLRDNELSFHFPGGYREIAHWLRPERIWLAWRYERPGERGGLQLDGLVILPGRAVWFPKPYRMLPIH